VTQLMAYENPDQEYNLRFGLSEKVIAVPERFVLSRYGLKTRQSLWLRRKAAKLPKRPRGGRRGTKLSFNKAEIEALDQVHIAICTRLVSLSRFPEKVNLCYWDLEGNLQFYGFSEFIRDETGGRFQAWKEYAIFHHDNGHPIFPDRGDIQETSLILEV